jgi:transcription factor SPT20 homolog
VFDGLFHFQSNLSPSSFLLDKLVTRERLHTLIINLYPGNKGYSLAFRPAASTPSSNSMVNPRHQQFSQSENLQETPSWLYDNAHLLTALDSEELPPLIIDFCNVHCPHLYYNGAVIAQIRDFRQSYPLDICDIHFVLLRPNSTALWDEINGAVDANWSFKERIAFESQLVLATAPPICLDPSPTIGIAAINATSERAPFSTEEVRKNARRFLQVTKNRNNKLEKKTYYHQTALASHLAVERRGLRREASRNVRAPELKQSGKLEGVECVSVRSLQPVAPTRGFDWQPKNTERLTFETDRDNCQYRVRVELFERATSCEVTGQLTLERQKVGQSSGRTCPFKLSSPLAARRYVKEFMGIFTEEGRKFVKITHERETRAGREVMEMQTGEKTQTMVPKIQTIPTSVLTPSGSITSPPPALIATGPIKLGTQQRIITTARSSPTTQQVVVLAQVKQESSGNQVIKNLLNQPRAPMTQTMVNGHNSDGLQTVYLQVDQSNLIHMGSAMPVNIS